MGDTRYLIFDCMETLVDIEGFGDTRDYACHTFRGSGAEDYWSDFDHFFRQYLRAREEFAVKLPENKEYGFRELFRQVCCSNERISADQLDRITGLLFDNYWRNYIYRCSVNDGVIETLALLNEEYTLGMISNFKVENGIETLLEQNGIARYFTFVITSMTVGWRKPDKRIYQAALSITEGRPEEHLFIGDDYVNDFQEPRKAGMKALLYDRSNRHPGVKERVSGIPEITVVLRENMI